MEFVKKISDRPLFVDFIALGCFSIGILLLFSDHRLNGIYFLVLAVGLRVLFRYLFKA